MSSVSNELRTDNSTKGRFDSGPLLNFSSAENLSIRRMRKGRGWAYYDGNGNRIADRDEINRLNALAFPPAYTDARYNPDPLGHLQVIGRDARGRTQYRYHPTYRESQEAYKFALCAEFGAALPRLRKHVSSALSRPATDRQAVIAALVRILDTAYLRIGNESYRKANNSFGLTTLRNRHVKLQGHSLVMQYRGKGGIVRSVRLTDKSLARIVRGCQDLPGQRLFQYQDDEGVARSIESQDVNAFLHAHLGDAFTAKHFRTWHASVIAFTALRGGQSLRASLDIVSQALGNTPAIARKSYVHPKLLTADTEILRKTPKARGGKWMSAEEKAFLAFLRMPECSDEAR